MGPPGSGKGTISSYFAETFGVKHISSGDLLRSHLQSIQSHELEVSMKEGKLISDHIIEQLVLPKLKEYSNSKGWLLDGYPRTLMQTKSLLSQQRVDLMINLNIPNNTIVERLSGRWVHVASGRIYHTMFNPPKNKGIDDVTGEPLEQREDDHPEVVRKRLQCYYLQTKPVIDYFNQLGILKSYSGTESKRLWPLIKKDIEQLCNL